MAAPKRRSLLLVVVVVAILGNGPLLACARRDPLTHGPVGLDTLHRVSLPSKQPHASRKEVNSTQLITTSARVKQVILAESELAVVATMGVLVGFLATLTALWGSNGYAFGLACALSCLCMNNFVRLAGQRGGMPAGFCMLVRTVCLTFGSSMMGRLREDPVTFWPETKTLKVRVLLRAAFGCCSVMSLFFAVDHIPMLLVLALSCTSSVWSALISSCTSEPLSRGELMLVLLGVSAVVLIIDPMALSNLYRNGASSSMNWLGLFLAALSAFCEAMAGVTSRSVRGQVHYLTLMFAQAAFGAIACLTCAYFFPKLYFVTAVGPYQLLLLVGVALSSFVMQITLNQAYMLEKTAPLQVFINAIVIMPQLGLDFLFGRRPGILSWIGIIILFIYLTLTWFAAHRREK